MGTENDQEGDYRTALYHPAGLFSSTIDVSLTSQPRRKAPSSVHYAFRSLPAFILDLKEDPIARSSLIPANLPILDRSKKKSRDEIDKSD